MWRRGQPFQCSCLIIPWLCPLPGLCPWGPGIRRDCDWQQQHVKINYTRALKIWYWNTSESSADNMQHDLKLHLFTSAFFLTGKSLTISRHGTSKIITKVMDAKKKIISRMPFWNSRADTVLSPWDSSQTLNECCCRNKIHRHSIWNIHKYIYYYSYYIKTVLKWSQKDTAPWRQQPLSRRKGQVVYLCLQCLLRKIWSKRHYLLHFSEVCEALFCSLAGFRTLVTLFIVVINNKDRSADSPAAADLFVRVWSMFLSVL